MSLLCWIVIIFCWTYFFFSGKVFGNDICASEFRFRYEGSIQPESLKILLEFTLARGNLTSLFKVLKLLYGKEHIQIYCF